MQAGAQAGKVARRAIAGRQAAGQAFDITDLRKNVFQSRQPVLAKGQSFDRVLAADNFINIEQGSIDPLPQQAGTHGSNGFIQNAQQGTGGTAVAQGAGKFQVTAGNITEAHKLVTVENAQAIDMIERRFEQIFLNIAQSRAGGGNPEGHRLAAEAFEGMDLEMFQQHISTIIEIEGTQGDNQGIIEGRFTIPGREIGIIRNQDFTGLNSNQFLAHRFGI